MAYRRYNIQFAFEEPISAGNMGKLTAMEAAIRVVKGLAVKINTGKANEEMTVVAKWHRCTHDEAVIEDCSLSEKDI